MDQNRTFTHPDVLGAGVAEGWAEPVTDPAAIDWPPRQAAALIPFEVIDGRPVNPCEKTGITRGRNQLGHWGEQAAADALVMATTPDGRRHVLLIERGDGHGWAIPGGKVDPGETPMAAAVRELEEETGLALPGAPWRSSPPRYVPDPRASDEAWMVTVLCIADLGTVDTLPAVAGADDADRAAWVRADNYDQLTAYLADVYGGGVFRAHVDMLRQAVTVAAIRADLEAITRRLTLHTDPDTLAALNVREAPLWSLFHLFRAVAELYAEAAALAGDLAEEYEAMGDPIGIADAAARQEMYTAEHHRHAAARDHFRSRFTTR